MKIANKVSEGSESSSDEEFSEAEASDSGLSPIRMVKLFTLLVIVEIRQTWDSNIVQKLDKSLLCSCVSFAFLVRHESEK